MPTMTPARTTAARTPGPACGDVHPELMFPLVESQRPGQPNTTEAAALAVCARCPVRTECLERVLEGAPLPYGVAGGLTAADRRAVRASRRGPDRSARPAATRARDDKQGSATPPPTPTPPAGPQIDLDAAIDRVMAVHEARRHGADPVKVRELAAEHRPASASRWEVALAAVTLLARGATVAAAARVLGEEYTQVARWRDRHHGGEGLVLGGLANGTCELPRPTHRAADPAGEPEQQSAAA